MSIKLCETLVNNPGSVCLMTLTLIIKSLSRCIYTTCILSARIAHDYLFTITAQCTCARETMNRRQIRSILTYQRNVCLILIYRRFMSMELFHKLQYIDRGRGGILMLFNFGKVCFVRFLHEEWASWIISGTNGVKVDLLIMKINYRYSMWSIPETNKISVIS